MYFVTSYTEHNILFYIHIHTECKRFCYDRYIDQKNLPWEKVLFLFTPVREIIDSKIIEKNNNIKI